MNELFRTKFDSDEEDEEYIPDKKELDQVKEVDVVKTKVDMSKVDAIWSKLKSKDKPKLKEIPPSAIPSNVSNKEATTEISEIKYTNDTTTVVQTKSSSIDEEIKKALDKSRELKSKITTETLMFAGQKFEYKKEVTEEDLKVLKNKEKKKTHSGLDSIVEQLEKKHNVNTYTKTKKDWNTYVEENKIQKDLDYNRKDGFLMKKQFIEETNVKLIENKKQIKRQKKE